MEKINDLGANDPVGSAEVRPINIRVEDWLRFSFWLVLVCAVGFLALNQGMGFFYKTHFLKAPCELCEELNPGVEQCINNLNAPRPSYWTPEGWSDPFAEQENLININEFELSPP